jgi:hypothetical protein
MKDLGNRPGLEKAVERGEEQACGQRSCFWKTE